MVKYKMNNLYSSVFHANHREKQRLEKFARREAKRQRRKSRAASMRSGRFWLEHQLSDCGTVVCCGGVTRSEHEIW